MVFVALPFVIVVWAAASYLRKRGRLTPLWGAVLMATVVSAAFFTNELSFGGNAGTAILASVPVALLGGVFGYAVVARMNN